jgi:putative spermidine/putrescine transport system substrate-binding protein
MKRHFELLDHLDVDRRFLLKGAMALAATAVMPLTEALAQTKKIVIANFGGDAQAAYEKVWGEPFRQTNGDVDVIFDSSGPSSGKIKAMVESGAVEWDICDRNMIGAQDLGNAGLLDPVNWSIVDENKLRPEHRNKWGVGSYLFSFVIAYDKEKFGDNPPKTWADFWNIKDFPGKRMLRKNVEGQLEAALLADGVAPADLYPLDVDRALDKIRQIREHAVFWDSGSSSQQIMRDGEAVMGNIWSTRATVVRADTNDRVTYGFNQGLVQAAAWLVPKGRPAGDEVWRFIASTQDPQSQVELFKLLGSGPINPAASELLPEELRAWNPGDPANLGKQVNLDPEWYAQHYTSVVDRYLQAISA